LQKKKKKKGEQKGGGYDEVKEKYRKKTLDI
jgi:hypothetical protein